MGLFGNDNANSLAPTARDNAEDIATKAAKKVLYERDVDDLRIDAKIDAKIKLDNTAEDLTKISDKLLLTEKRVEELSGRSGVATKTN